jgi:two-component system cell cycle sensor histidine kinase/response regulator CckA
MVARHASPFNGLMDEPLYRAVLVASADPVALLDTDGTILFVSDSIERLTGFAPAKLIGRSALDQVHPDDKRRVHAALIEALGRPETPIAVEYRSQHQDGSWRDREVVGVNRLHDPDIGAVVVNYRDTTARRCAEAALEESERLHQSTFDEAPIGVAHTSLSGRFLRVNRWLCHVLGYSAEELGSLDFVAISHPDDVKQDVQARQRLIAGKLDRYTREKQYRRKDGRFVPVNLAVSVHRNREGNAVYFIAVIEDLTERKRLEQELRHAHKMEAIGRLAGGIAHDFNNLLVVIGGYADLVLHSLGPDHPVRQDVAEIQAAARSAAALTRQLLAFSRRQILQPQVLDLNHVLRRVESLLRRVIGEDITLVMTLAARLRRVHTDPGQVEQIIMNLAVNARDAMPNGGVLTIETANVDLDAGFVDHHRGSAIGPHVMIAASDTGSGMDAETLPHVFEPFFTTKPVGRGTGLGLSTVYGIVKQSHGSIWVDSEVGYGSTFKIYLPAILTEAEPRIDAPSAASRARGTETILVIEDDSQVRRFIVETLTRDGYGVHAAASGGDALVFANDEKRVVDVVLTDVVLTGLSGREIAQLVVAKRPNVRVIYMSGYTDDAIVHHGVLDKGLTFLQKPFSAQELLTRIREVLDSNTPPPS